ncbi:MAG: hypothetical protein K2G37_04080 [Clostridia bacterium]|nr:hypothetical protein [Clostridia bacterium]MDE7328501.1 hypothetical protein [Clostridia bacterium]
MSYSHKQKNNSCWKPGDELTQQDRELLQRVVALAKKLGRTPIKSECKEASKLKARFRTWHNVILASGLPPLADKEQERIRKEKNEK